MSLPLAISSQDSWPNPNPIDQAERTWLLNGAIFLTTFEQVIDPGKSDTRDGPDWYQSWEYWYNRNLVGKDKLPSVRSAIDLPPAYSVAESYPYRFWSFGPTYFTVKKPNLQSDWPVPVGAEPDWRRSWEWWFKPYYAGKDKLPNRQMDWPNPVQPFRPDASYIAFFSRELFGRDKMPRNQDDFPNPVPPHRMDQFAWGFFNQLLVGKDKLPRNQKDWPNPVQPFIPERTHTAWFNYNLVGKDKLPVRNSYPIPPPLEWYRDWSQRYIRLVSPLGITPNAFPILLGYPDPYRSYEFWYNQNLIGQDKLPIRQQDWPNPYPVQWYRDWSENLKQTELNTLPFVQSDWPNPYPVQWYQEWYQNPLLLLNKPFSQLDWPLPYPVDWYQWWFQNLQQTGLTGTPVSQLDWPTPYPVQWYQDWSQNLALTTPVAKPFPNLDFPNPYPVNWYLDFNQNTGLLFPPPPPPPPPEPFFMAGLFSSHALHGHSGHIQTGDQN